MNKIYYVAILLMISQVSFGAATTRYVWTNSPSAGTPYDTWNKAAHTITAAVSAASAGDTVLVTNGTYVVSTQISISIGITVTSVNGSAVTIVDGNYPATTNRCFNLTVTNVLLDGFTITKGGGGGAGTYGGGIYLAGGGVVRNCLISNNVSTYDGGISIHRGVVDNCLIIVPNVLITNCWIIGNVSKTSTGGYGGSANVYNSVIANNRCTNGTAGGCKLSGDGTTHLYVVQNCIITNNFSKNQGGGVYIDGVWGLMTVRNCLIADNVSSNSNGGGLYCSSTGTVQNCTIVSNIAPKGSGGGICWVGTVANGRDQQIQNSIIWGNTALDTYSNYYNTGSVSYSNCCFAPVLTDSSTNLSANNIADDPRLIGLSSGNFRLAQNSPCLNSGLNQDWMTNSVDLDGRMRIRYGTVDMGTYEIIYEGTIYRLGF